MPEYVRKSWWEPRRKRGSQSARSSSGGNGRGGSGGGASGALAGPLSRTAPAALGGSGSYALQQPRAAMLSHTASGSASGIGRGGQAAAAVATAAVGARAAPYALPAAPFLAAAGGGGEARPGSPRHKGVTFAAVPLPPAEHASPSAPAYAPHPEAQQRRPSVQASEARLRGPFAASLGPVCPARCTIVACMGQQRQGRFAQNRVMYPHVVKSLCLWNPRGLQVMVVDSEMAAAEGPRPGSARGSGRR
jgi:hypothetical protein